MAAPLDVSVIVCTRERPVMVADTVASILEGDRVPREIVVVDQSTEPQAALASMGAAAGCEVRYVHAPGRGLSRARNVGLRAAGQDVAVLVDDDMFVEHSWLERLVAALEGPRTVATGRVLAGEPEVPGASVPAAALVTSTVAERFRGLQPRDVVPGANVALFRDAVRDVGGFDERLGAGTRFGAADDNDIGLRLLDAGCEVRHVPDAVMIHRAWRDEGEGLRLRWRYGRGKGAFYAKHLGREDRYARTRLRRELGLRVRRIAAAVRSPAALAGEAAYLAGLLSAVAEWRLRERGHASSPASHRHRVDS